MDDVFHGSLSLAVQNGHDEIADILLAKFASLGSNDTWGGLFWTAVRERHYKTIRVVLENVANFDFRNQKGYTPLLIACRHAQHDRDMIKILLANGANLEASDSCGHTPLSWAANRGNLRTVKLLVAKGANLDTECTDGDYRGYTPLLLAALHQHTGVFEFLHSIATGCTLESGTGYNKNQAPLIFAVERRLLPMIKYLLTRNAFLDAEYISGEDKGRTALSIAAGTGQMQIVRTLLGSERVDINSRDRNGRRPLSWAAANGHDDVVERLLAHRGVQPQFGDDDGRSPLSLAAENGHSEIVKLLCQHSNTVSLDKRGRAPLWWAAKNKHEKAIEVLARVDSITMNLLIREGDYYSVESLLRAGYDANKADTRGIAPLRLALRQKQVRILALLLRYPVSTEGTFINEWIDAHSNRAACILVLSELSHGGKLMELSAGKFPPRPIDRRRTFLLMVGGNHWPKVPFAQPTAHLKPYGLDVVHQEQQGTPGMEFFVSVCFPVDNKVHRGCFKMPDWDEYKVAWSILPPRDPNEESWISVEHFSMLPYVWIPNDGVDFFLQFMRHLEEKWQELCTQAEEHLFATRLDRLQSEGKNPEFMRRLAKDAQKWAELRHLLKDHFHTAQEFVEMYCERFNKGRDPTTIEQLRSFELNISNRLNGLDATIKELLQIEFSWAAITESRISTRLGQNVMLLTYVSIFYLPLAFCAALWAIPNISDNDTRNSFILTSLVVGLLTLMIAFNLENITGLVTGLYITWRAMVVTEMQSDLAWREKGESLQDSGLNRIAPSEWLLVGFVISKAFGKLRRAAANEDANLRV